MCLYHRVRVGWAGGGDEGGDGGGDEGGGWGFSLTL